MSGKFLLMLLIGILPGLSSGQKYPADLKPCSKEAGALCGKLRVFENRALQAGRTIELNVVVLPALGTRRFRPLFDLQGGPGVGATADLELFVKEIPQYRQGRDIVLVDQRGTGDSNPLRCAPLLGSTGLEEMYPVEYVKKCRSDLEKRADLTKYTTEIAMDDLDEVRRWLGYDKIDLFGLSYGTRAVQVYVRQHPTAVGRIVLMGSIGTYHKMPFYHAPNAQASLDLLLAECGRDEQCNAAFPKVKEELRALILDLKKNPAKVDYSDPATKSARTYRIRADIFAEQIRKWLYSRDTAQQVPLVIHNAAHGNFTPFLRRILQAGSDSGFIADGMYLSVTCAEDVPFIDEAEAAKLSRDTIFGNYRVSQQERACALWPRGRIGKEFRDPVVSDVRVMFVRGGMDPVTAPAWADDLAKGFKDHVIITVPEQAHIPGGLSDLDCEDKIIVRFLSDLPIYDAETACLKAIKPGPFLIAESKE